MRKVLERHEVLAEVKWKLEDIYASDELFERDLAAARAGLAGVQELRGSITSSQNLLKVLKRRDELGMLVDRLTAYAFMRHDEDNGNSKYQAYADRALSVDVMARSAFAFLEPEILSLESTTVWEWVEAEPELAVQALSPQCPPHAELTRCRQNRSSSWLRLAKLRLHPGTFLGCSTMPI